MEKPSPRENKGVVKDGVHIICPSIVTLPAVQFIIREKVLDAARDFFGGKYTNKVDDIVDIAVISRNNWFVYGSRKPEDVEGYTISFIYQADKKEVIPFKPRVDREILELMSIRNKYIPTPIIEGKQEEVDEYLKKEAEVQKAKEKGKSKKNYNPIFNEENYEVAKKWFLC